MSSLQCPTQYSTVIKKDGKETCQVTDNHFAAGQAISEEGVLQEGDFKGLRVGVCETESGVYYSEVASETPWTPAWASSVVEIVGSSHDVMLNVNKNRPSVCVKIAQEQPVRGMISRLNKGKCEGLPTDQCEELNDALKSGYRQHFKEEPPTTIWEDVVKGLKYCGGGAAAILGGVATFFVVGPWVQKKLFEPKDPPGPPSMPSSGPYRTNARDTSNDQPRVDMAAKVEVAAEGAAAITTVAVESGIWASIAGGVTRAVSAAGNILAAEAETAAGVGAILVQPPCDGTNNMWCSGMDPNKVY
jgi:hypothetical protein